MPTVTVDDSDTSQLVYHGTWFKGGSSSELNGTTHGTTTVGGYVAFNFTGTAVMVYGTVAGATKGNTALSVFQVDYSSPVRVTAPVSSSPSYHEVLYRSPDLQDGPHKLLVTVLGEGNFTFWLDYIRYESSGNTTTTSASVSAPTSSASPSAASNVSASPTSTSSSDSSSSPSNLPAIIVAVLVPLFLIIFTLLGIFWWKKRRDERRLRSHFLLDDDSGNGAQTASVPTHARVINPFYAAPPLHEGPSGTSVREVDEASTPLSRGLTISNPDFSAVSAGSDVPFAYSDGPLVDFGPTPSHGGKQNPLPTTPNRTAYRQHDDGGVRLDVVPEIEPSEVVDLPPVYRRY